MKTATRRSLLLAGLLLCLVALPAARAEAATITWNGGGSDNNWSTCANWSSSICPTSADTVVFNGTSVKNSTVDAGFAGTVAAIQMNSGYTGTTTLARSLTSSGGNYTQSAGTFDISGQTFTLSGTSGSLTVSSGTFLASNATTTFSGNAGTQTLTCTGTFPGVIDPGSGGAAFSLASGCAATLAKTISKSGSISLAGDATAVSGSTITISGGAGSLTVTGSLTGLPSLATTTFSGNGGTQTLTCTGIFPGVIDPGSNNSTFSLASGCSAALGSAVSKTGTITINGTLNTINFNISSGTFTVNNGGTLKLQGGQTTFTQPVLNSGSTVEYTGASTYTKLMAGSSYSNLVISGSGTFSTSTALTITDNFTQTAGSFTPSATTTFSGGNGATVTTTSGSHFSSININKTSATVTLVGSGLTTTGNLLISAGTLDASTAGCSSASCPITIAGYWSNSGTFTARTGTVTLNGSNQSFAGATTFYNLTKSTAITDTLTFPAGLTQTITNTLTLNGAASNLLSLRSSSDGSQWLIDPQGARTVSYLNVKDSHNVNGTDILVNDGTDINALNNIGWQFDLVASPTVRTIRLHGRVRLHGGVRFE